MGVDSFTDTVDVQPGDTVLVGDVRTPSWPRVVVTMHTYDLGDATATGIVHGSHDLMSWRQLGIIGPLGPMKDGYALLDNPPPYLRIEIGSTAANPVGVSTSMPQHTDSPDPRDLDLRVAGRALFEKLLGEGRALEDFSMFDAFVEKIRSLRSESGTRQ